MPSKGSFDPTKDLEFPELAGNVFVFGSNLGGHHGAGAAATALKRYGAVNGIGEGLMGVIEHRNKQGMVNRTTFLGINHTCSYAVPTKGFSMETLPLFVVAYFVDRLHEATTYYPELHFHVTRIGCGLAGLSESGVAALFAEHIWDENVTLPICWDGKR